MVKCVGLSKPLKVSRVIQIIYSFIINEPERLMARGFFEPENFTARESFKPEM